jgi:hypothetical protein
MEVAIEIKLGLQQFLAAKLLQGEYYYKKKGWNVIIFREKY